MEVNTRSRFFSLRQKFAETLKAYAVAGLIVLIPFAATYMSIKWFLNFFQGIIFDRYFQVFSYAFLNSFLRIGATLLILVVSVVLVGRVFSTRRGKGLEEKIDFFFTELPFVGSVYGITKKAADTVFHKSEEFQHPVKLSHQGMTFTGFQTGNSSEEGKKMVFVPTSPNVTSGFLLEVDEDRVEETEESLEQAFTKVLSAGFSN